MVKKKRRRIVIADPGPKPTEVTDQNDNQDEWTNLDSGLVGSKVSHFAVPDIDPVDEEKLNRCKTAYDFYKLFNTQEFLEQIMDQSKLYATQKGKEKLIPIVTEDNMRAF